LCDRGASLVVSATNVHEYVCLLSEHMLCGHTRPELHATLKGLWAVVPLAALVEARIDAIDLGLLLAGVPSLDVDQWQAHTQTESAADVSAAAAAARTAAFFRVLASFSDELRGRTFAFATALPRLPAAGGFARLSPPFTLQMLGTAFAGRLPVAHTCFNALQLAPPTSTDGASVDLNDDAALARALKTAVHYGGEGFGLV
jgi:E3 ubiquitin ligase SMURF1/2/E3 ubiquitin-protein ligase NEDD4